MKYFFSFLFLSFCLFSVEKQPWFEDIYEFNLLGKYEYSFFNKIDKPIQQLTSYSHGNLFYFDLNFVWAPQLSTDVDLQFSTTSMQSFGFRSTAIQMRYLWLDDIVGDFVSLVTSIATRYVSKKSFRDINNPLYGRFSLTGDISVGKEIDLDYLRLHFWGDALVGIPSNGSPWLEGILAFNGVFDDSKIELLLNGIRGYGKNRFIDVENFNGYGNVRKKILDLQISYSHKMSVWGFLSCGYQRRLLAKTAPENVNTFFIEYLYPFSF